MDIFEVRLLPYGTEWLTAKKDLWHVSRAPDNSPHFNILGIGGAKRLRPADKIEIQAGKLVEWKKKRHTA